MMKKIAFLLLSISFLASCKVQKVAQTRADLKPLAKIYVLNKDEAPVKPAYALSFYTDRRIELIGYSKIDKTGNFTTMLNAKEYADFEILLKKLKSGHVTFNHPTQNLGYDVVYYAMKKEISMANAKILPINEETATVIRTVDDYITDKSWIKKENAPKIFGDEISNEVIVTLKQGGKINTILEPMNPTFGLKKLRKIDENTNTYLVRYEKGDKHALLQNFRKNTDVLGVIENSYLRTDQNAVLFDTKELIIQFSETMNMDEWVKTYAPQQMKFLKQIAPNINNHVVSFNSAFMSTSNMISLIKKDKKVKEVQTNKQILLPRE